MSVSQNELPIAFVRQFEDEIYVLSQQQESRLMKYVRQKPIVGSQQYFDRRGSVDPVLKTQLVQPTVYATAPHSRRQVSLKDYVQALPIDRQARIRLQHDFTGDYVQMLGEGMGRQVDLDIIAALEGNSVATDAQLGASVVPLPSAQIIPVDYQFGGGGTDTNFTLDKLRQMKFLFDTAEVPKNKRYIAWNASAEQSLIRDVQVTSSDFNTMRVLNSGELDSYMGFKFERLELITGSNTEVANVIGFQERGIGMSVGIRFEVNVDRIPQMNQLTQIHVAGTWGMVRIEEVTVVVALCKQDV